LPTLLQFDVMDKVTNATNEIGDEQL